MPCPDELTLELWSADALAPAEAAAVAAHVATCATCTAQQARGQASAALLRDALQLDADEQTYLASLDLAAPWRARAASPAAAPWGWLALLGVVATFVAWALFAETAGQALALASLVGVSTVLLTTLIELLLSVGQALIALSTNPLLQLSQPLLALLAVALLFLPRRLVAVHHPQGVRS